MAAAPDGILSADSEIDGVNSTITSNGSKNFSGATEELLRQKSFLERAVASLRQQMQRQSQNEQLAYFHQLKENKFLLEEIESLKIELRESKRSRHTPQNWWSSNHHWWKQRMMLMSLAAVTCVQPEE